MHNKSLSVLILIILMAMAMPLGMETAYAQKADNDNIVIPDAEGTYNVPGRPELKVKVFVYKPLPTPVQEPVIVCYLNDPDSTAAVGAAGWHLPNGNWKYTLNLTSVPSSVGSSNLPAIALNAFSEWSGATGTAPNVVFVRDSTNTLKVKAAFDGKNIIAWGRTSGSALAITYTWYYQSSGLVAEVDTIMNNRYPWKWSNPFYWTNPSTMCADSSSYDAQDILTHELGHWMGLNDMYNSADFQNATMYGYGEKAEIKKDTLSTGDIAGLKLIY